MGTLAAIGAMVGAGGALAAPAPVISAFTVTDNGDGTATAAWTTDIAATTVVDFGATTGYGSTASSASPVTSHSISVPAGTGVWRCRPSSVANGQTTLGADAEMRVTTLVFRDLFTGGASGDDLTTHAADVGGSWVRAPTGATQKMMLDGAGYARQDAANSGYDYYLRDADSATLYQEITMKVVNKLNSSTWGVHLQMMLDWAGGQRDRTGCTLASGSANLVDSMGVIAANSAFTYANGSTNWLRLKYDGKWIMQRSADGSSWTDFGSTYPCRRNDLWPKVHTVPGAWGGPGRVGIMLNGAGGASTGVHVDEFSVREILPNAAYKLVIFDGNSIARGTGTSNNYTLTWAQKWLDSQADSNVVISNIGVGSQNTPQMTLYSPAKIAALAQRGYTKVVIVVHEGSNHMVALAASAATAYAEMNTYKAAVNAALPAGVDPVWVITKALPRSLTAGYNAKMETFNALIDASAIADGWDHILTFSDSLQLSANNPDGGPNGTYYPDGVHPNDAGNVIMAADLDALTDTFL